MRRLYFTLPEALSRSQPGVRQAAYRHFRLRKLKGQVWELSHPQETLRWVRRGRAEAYIPKRARVGGQQGGGVRKVWCQVRKMWVNYPQGMLTGVGVRMGSVWGASR